MLGKENIFKINSWYDPTTHKLYMIKGYQAEKEDERVVEKEQTTAIC
jgi:hypothetical protein